jgi:hypothetical protein
MIARVLDKKAYMSGGSLLSGQQNQYSLIILSALQKQTLFFLKTIRLSYCPRRSGPFLRGPDVILSVYIRMHADSISMWDLEASPQPYIHPPWTRILFLCSPTTRNIFRNPTPLESWMASNRLRVFFSLLQASELQYTSLILHSSI